MNPDDITLGLVLTTAGAAVFAAIITGIVEIFSRTIGAVQGHEQGLALVLAAIVVIAAIAEGVQSATITFGIGTVFAGILAWYGVARVSMGIHDDFIDRSNTTAIGKAI